MNSQPQSGRCPMCDAEAVYKFRPFCSKRCADLDLARWLKGNYAIPGPPASPEEMHQADDGASPSVDPDHDK